MQHHAHAGTPDAGGLFVMVRGTVRRTILINERIASVMIGGRVPASAATVARG